MNPMVKILSTVGDVKRVARETGVSIPTIRKYSKLLDLAPEIQEGLSTSDGPAGVETLAILADTFAIEDQAWVLAEICGFGKGVQQEILKASDGDKDRIPELKELALDKAFNVRMCREGLCFRMSDEWKAKIKEQLGRQPRLL